jgi:hypothetical protein
VFEHQGAVVGHMFIVRNRHTAPHQHLCQALLPLFKGAVPEILELELEQVEGNQRHVMVALDNRRSPARRVPEGKPLSLFNPIGENHPSSSRRLELFAIPAVTYGLPDFAFGDCQAFG